MKKIIIFLVSIAISLSAEVSVLKVNSQISLLDKYEYLTPKNRKVKIPHKSKLLIIAFEKKMEKRVSKYLLNKDKYYLQKNDTVFISDISKVPTIFTKLFTLPTMKEYKYPLYLQYDKEFKRVVPQKRKHLTLVEVVDRKVSTIYFTNNIEKISLAIEK